MTVLDLDHYSIAITPEALQETARFYTEVIGLRDGPRPDFAFPGRWLYCGDTAVVHLLGTGGPKRQEAPGTGQLDHIAFRASGLAAMRAKLRKFGIAHRERTVPGRELQQIFVQDPAGILIELNYAGPAAG
ncbi:MAG: VOC family protein [Alphaproteobacteria bacterium]